MDKIGLNLPAGRRKAANVTLLTSLVEGKSSARTSRLFLAPAISGTFKMGKHVFFYPLSLSLCWKSAYALIRVMWTDFASQVIKHEGCVRVCVCVKSERDPHKYTEHRVNGAGNSSGCAALALRFPERTRRSTPGLVYPLD